MLMSEVPLWSGAPHAGWVHHWGEAVSHERGAPGNAILLSPCPEAGPHRPEAGPSQFIVLVLTHMPD